MPPALPRRNLPKLAVAGGGWLILRPDGTVKLASDLTLPASPYTTPFLDELPLPGLAVDIKPKFVDDIPDEYTQYWDDPETTPLFKICSEVRRVTVQDDLLPTMI